MRDKRQRILEATMQAIATNGLQFQIAMIAEMAEVATGSVYNYFESKTALIEGVYAQFVTKLGASVPTKYPVDMPHAERIRTYLSRYVDFIVENADQVKMFNYLDNAPEIDLGKLDSIFAPLSARSTQLFEDAQEAGIVREGPPHLIASVARGTIRHAVRRRRRLDPSPITPDEAAWILEVSWAVVEK